MSIRLSKIKVLRLSLACVGSCVIAFFVMKVTFATPESLVQGASVSPGHDDTDVDAASLKSSLVVLEQEHRRLISELRDGDVPGAGRGPVEYVTDPSGPPPDAVFAYLNFDLAAHFVNRLGAFESESLLRHRVLNMSGISAPAVVRNRVDEFISNLNDRFAPLMRNYRLTRLREMALMAEEGLVVPIDVAPPSDSALRFLAGQLLQSSEELASSGQTVDSLAAELAKAPPQNVAEDHIVHKGKVYLQRDFPSLPVSGRMFDVIRFAASECLASCAAEFGAAGFAVDGDGVSDAFQRLAVLMPGGQGGGRSPK